MLTKYQDQLQHKLLITTRDIRYYLTSQTSEYDQRLLHTLNSNKVDAWPELLDIYCPPALKTLQRQLSLQLAALSQLTIGMYGYCATCDDVIEEALLEENPTAQYCAKCLKKR